MASKQEIQAQIDALTADLDNADDDDTELWVEHPRTKAVGRLKGAHAKSFLDGILGTDDPDPAPDPKKKGKAKPKDDEDDDDPDPDPAPRSSVWGRK
jgi:hypothetical protein